MRRTLPLLVLLAGCARIAEPERDPLAGVWAVDPTGALQGAVLTPTGTPAAGAWVTVSPGGYETRADEQGAFVFARLDPGPVVVQAAHDGAVGAIDASITEDETTAIDLRLAPLPEEAGQLSVWVSGPDGGPAAGAVVTAGGETATADADGLAVFSGLSGASVDVIAADADGALWPFEALSVEIPANGNATIELSLSGRPPAGSDFLGSATCGACHGAVRATHQLTAHARAALASGAAPAEVVAAFDGSTVIDLGGGLSAALVAGPAVELRGSGGATWSIDGWIGDPSRGAVPWTTVGGVRQPLPIATDAGRADRAGTPDGARRWGPFEVDRWADGAAFRSAPAAARGAETECLACHVTGTDVSVGAGGLASIEWTELGVGCEACHGPGGGHVFSAPADKLRTITQPQYLDRARADAVCAQCHGGLTADGTGLPFPHASRGTFRPGERLDAYAAATPTSWPSGAAAAPHQQHDELSASGHGGLLRCTDCHTVHEPGLDEAQLTVSAADNGMCTSCHLGLDFGGLTGRAAAHTGHGLYDPAGPTQGGRCTSCHMPRTASDALFSPFSGSGNLPSHGFVALSPNDTIAVFGGAATLPVGEHPQHACGDCHTYNGALWQGLGLTFPAPHGDPALRSSHAAYAPWFAAWFP